MSNPTTYQALRIGLTGGIGSGKSRVGKVLEALGHPVYYADARAKALMVENERIVAGVKEAFGADAYFPNGSLNRAYLGEKVFGDPAQLQKLNGIVHPETGRDWVAWDQQRRIEGHRLTFKEAAILYESGAYHGVDQVWTIYAPKRLRLQRAMRRDDTTESAILQRMGKQISEQKKLHRAAFAIFSDEVHHLLPQVRAALASVREVARGEGE